MPDREPVALAADDLTLRLIGPRADVWPGSPTADVTVLGRSDLVARKLACSQLPSSPDLVSGGYTLRRDDAGESSWTFPNVVGSDGTVWREAFDPSGHLMFLEVYLGGELEQVVCIDTVAVSDGRGFSATDDATDFCSSLWGNGAGLQSGTTGQLQAVVYDPATLQASVFDAQGWQDSSDAAFVALLQAVLNSELGLRLEPWQLLSADPSSSGEGSVVVHGQDGMFLLKKAYVRDWTTVQSPRDVIERGTQLWVPVTFDEFPAGSLNGQWMNNSSAGSSVSIASGGGLLMAVTSPPAVAAVDTGALGVMSTGAWRATASVNWANSNGNSLQFIVTESSGHQYQVTFTPVTGVSTALFQSSTVGTAATAQVPSSATYEFLLESDGEWVWAFVNGQFIGIQRRSDVSTTSLETSVHFGGSITNAGQILVASVLAEALQPFLQRGSDRGDYVLPGDGSTYPSGGMYARYYNDTDLQSDPSRLSKILAPSRSQAYAGSGSPEYANQQDLTISGQSAPTPGAAAQGWSAIWFGAIYLKLSAGDYTFRIDTPGGGSNGTAVRAWIGKTQFGAQLVDEWAFNGSNEYSFTVDASALAGDKGYGRGTVARDGWYPIKIEYALDSGGVTAGGPVFRLTNSPAAYTDPGGTAIAAGAQATVVPATSLSPLGCVDQRYQGVSHFDLVQQTAQAYGYQAAVEPQALESGLFPGVLAPRIREGQDMDPILTPPKDARSDWVGILRPQLANTWPLPGALAKMRWRPGDGIRVQDSDINVWDTSPRQILTFTRNLFPGGVGSAVASLANRPRTAARSLKRQLYSASRWQRNYQRQLVALTGTRETVTLTNQTDPNSSLIILAAGDTLVRARLRISTNSGGVPLYVVINFADVTTTLNGPWTAVPLNIDISNVVTLGADNRLVVQLKTISGTPTTVDYQIFLDVLR